MYHSLMFVLVCACWTWGVHAETQGPISSLLVFIGEAREADDADVFTQMNWKRGASTPLSASIERDTILFNLTYLSDHFFLELQFQTYFTVRLQWGD